MRFWQRVSITGMFQSLDEIREGSKLAKFRPEFTRRQEQHLLWFRCRRRPSGTGKPFSLIVARLSPNMSSVPSAGHCHMDDLPDEIFARILNLITINQVIRCSIVSKRWDAACRYLIRTRESVTIASDSNHQRNEWWKGDGHWEELSQRTDDIMLADKSLMSKMISSLNQIVELRRLRVEMHNVNPMDISPFVRKFADQLMMLEVDFALILIGPDVTFPHLTRLRCRSIEVRSQLSSAAFPKLAELFVDEQKLPDIWLPSLQKLRIRPGDPGNIDRDVELFKGFLLANAASLSFLWMPGFHFRLDHAAVFPNLTQLCCSDVYVPGGGCPFPALKHLTAGDLVTTEFLTRLPAEQMLSVDIRIFWDDERVVSAVSQMKHLRNISLTYSGAVNEGHPLSSIFDSMHHLEKVELIFLNCSLVDRMVSTLANQNPKLAFFRIETKRLTDAALTSLAQLQHLIHVEIFCVSAEFASKNATTTGVLTLLRGASRNVIRNFKIDIYNVDEDQVISEIRLMCGERGTTFDPPPSYPFIFEIPI